MTKWKSDRKFEQNSIRIHYFENELLILPVLWKSFDSYSFSQIVHSFVKRTESLKTFVIFTNLFFSLSLSSSSVKISNDFARQNDIIDVT